jgi:flagellin-like hook-associated protein FlgL
MVSMTFPYLTSGEEYVLIDTDRLEDQYALAEIEEATHREADTGCVVHARLPIERLRAAVRAAPEYSEIQAEIDQAADRMESARSDYGRAMNRMDAIWDRESARLQAEASAAAEEGTAGGDARRNDDDLAT